MIDNIFQDIKHIKEIKGKYLKILEKKLFTKIIDLIFHKPYNVQEFKIKQNLSQCKHGENILIKATILDQENLSLRKNRSVIKVKCEIQGVILYINFFHYNNKQYVFYIKNKLKINHDYYFIGKIEISTFYTINNPEIQDSIKPHLNNLLVNPIYHLTAGITNNQLYNYIQKALLKVQDLPEWIDDNILNEMDWPSWKNAVNGIHNITSASDILPTNRNIERLAYDEIFARQLNLLIMRYQQNNNSSINFTGDLRNIMIKNLPFQLTDGQAQVIEEISNDQKLENNNTRLLQGDVGCGKTIVALAIMLNAVEDKKQALLIVPTAILATQHFQFISNELSKINYDIKVELLTGKTTAKNKKIIKEKLINGDIDIIIGTHALIEDDVLFSSLATIIIDEQHKFGVEQRFKLCTKGNIANVLLMTATPIPRTLSMMNYGNIDISYLKEKPAFRQEIETKIMSDNKIDDIIQHLSSAIEDNKKIYWICPMVEKSEKMEIMAVEDRYQTLNNIFGKKVIMIHGKLKESEKDKIMCEFRDNDNLNILVATTVIEVGIDIKTASIIIIENAERFGLSQLHQLRGRVGRGDIKSYCILIYKNPISKVSYTRLQAMKDSNDGFYLSEVDLKIRGAGNVIGKEQSGFPNFKFFDYDNHMHLIQIANREAKKTLKEFHDINDIYANKSKYINLMRLFNFNKFIDFVKF